MVFLADRFPGFGKDADSLLAVQSPDETKDESVTGNAVFLPETFRFPPPMLRAPEDVGINPVHGTAAGDDGFPVVADPVFQINIAV